MNIYVYTDVPDSLHLAIAADTLRGAGNAVTINPTGDHDISVHNTWLILNMNTVGVTNVDQLRKLLNDVDINVKIGYVGKLCPEGFKEFIGIQNKRFEHFTTWDNLIYKTLWTTKTL